MDNGKAFIEHSAELLQHEFFPRIRIAVEQLSDEQIWWRPNEASNSIGNLILHLAGNVSQWIIGGVGNRPVIRNRQEEFDERSMISGSKLLEKLERTLDDAKAVLSAFHSSALSERRTIQGNDVTVLQAIYHVVEHFSMHTGQVLLLTKLITAKDLPLYEFPDGVAKK